MSLGAGHTWAPDSFGCRNATGGVVIVCTRCGAVRAWWPPKSARFARRFARVNWAIKGMKASESLYTGRPLGTCPKVARRLGLS